MTGTVVAPPVAEPAAGSVKAAPRLLALDVFRGGTVAAMILVNNPGTWGAIYPPLRHAAWHGLTPTDLVFPFFLFVVGVAIAFAILRRRESGAPRAALARKIGRRAVVLAGIGILLSGFPSVVPTGLFTGTLADAAATWRLLGVLQRIALCYAAAALLALFLTPRALALLTLVLLVGYHLLLVVPALPDGTPQDIDVRGGTLVGWVDRAVFGAAHLWIEAPPERAFDPEGLLSTLPAIATTLLGVSAGRLLRSTAPLPERVLGLFVRGALSTAAGFVWSWFLPLNKPLWTSSYALVTAGCAATGLALCLWWIDLSGRRRCVEPLRIYGVNALTVFVGSALVARLLGAVRTGGPDGMPLRAWLYERGFAGPHARLVEALGLGDRWIAEPEVPSLAWALAWVFAWLAVLTVMDRRGLHWKV